MHISLVYFLEIKKGNWKMERDSRAQTLFQFPPGPQPRPTSISPSSRVGHRPAQLEQPLLHFLLGLPLAPTRAHIPFFLRWTGPTRPLAQQRSSHPFPFLSLTDEWGRLSFPSSPGGQRPHCVEVPMAVDRCAQLPYYSPLTHYA